MSSQTAKRTRAQKYQNSFAFKAGMHGQTPTQKKISALRLTGICARCFEILEWKRKFGKFKPLTVPAKCTKCSQRTITSAYRLLCNGCASGAGVCSKCGKVPPMTEEELVKKEVESGLIRVKPGPATAGDAEPGSDDDDYEVVEGDDDGDNSN